MLKSLILLNNEENKGVAPDLTKLVLFYVGDNLHCLGGMYIYDLIACIKIYYWIKFRLRYQVRLSSV